MSDGHQGDTEHAEVMVITPAGRLAVAVMRRDTPIGHKNAVINTMVNEAAAARDLLRVVIEPGGGGTVGISPEADGQAAKRYGKAKRQTDEALSVAGISPEIVRYENPGVMQ